MTAFSCLDGEGGVCGGCEDCTPSKTAKDRGPRGETPPEVGSLPDIQEGRRGGRDKTARDRVFTGEVRVVPKVGDQKTSSVRIEEALEDDQR